MEGLSPAELILGTADFEAHGRCYKLRALPLRHVISGEFGRSGLIIPREADNPGRFQLLNLQDKDKAAELDRWLAELLTLDGAPMSLQAVADADWDIVDVGRFLDRVVQISG